MTDASCMSVSAACSAGTSSSSSLSVLLSEVAESGNSSFERYVSLAPWHRSLASQSSSYRICMRPSQVTKTQQKSACI